MKFTLLITFILLFVEITPAQKVEPIFIETQATITSVESRLTGRRLITTAKVTYVIQNGDSLTGQVSLNVIPIIGSSIEAGDTITIEYDMDNPYLIITKETSFLQSYGLYILIALGLLFTSYKYFKRKKTA